MQGAKLFQASPYERQIHLCLWSNQSRCLDWQWRLTKQWRRWSAENNLEMNTDSELKVTGPQNLIHTVLCLLIDSQLWLFFFLTEGTLWINNTWRRFCDENVQSRIQERIPIDLIPFLEPGKLKLYVLSSVFQAFWLIPASQIVAHEMWKIVPEIYLHIYWHGRHVAQPFYIKYCLPGTYIRTFQFRFEKLKPSARK